MKSSFSDILNHSNNGTFRAFSHTVYFIAALSFCIFLVLVNPGSSGSYNSDKFDHTPIFFVDSFKRVTVVAAGDAMSHMPIVKSVYNDSCKCYDYLPIFQYIKKYVQQGDLKIVNYETTNAGFPHSGFPMFSSPDTFAYNLNQAGFNFLVYANNHAVDKGYKGLDRTLSVFEKAGIPYAGIYRSPEERKARYPYILHIKGLKIALLNYAYSANGMPVPYGICMNLIDTLQMASDMKAARDSASDAIVIYMHWGLEYQRFPNYEQKNIAGFLFRNGADVLIGSHPHVVQPIEVQTFTYNNKPKQGLVIWSLGNFIANQRKRYSDGGLMVKFDIVKNKYTGVVKIDNIRYLPFWVYKQLSPFKYRILPVVDFENDSSTFKMNAEDKAAFKLFISDVKPHLATDTARIKMWLP